MIVHFSCGAASAVSALICMAEGNDVELVYTDPGMEHEDNKRFLFDFEKLTGQKVTILKSKKYKSPIDVFEKRRFLKSPHGAPCTTELKKNTAREYLENRLYEEVNIFGFDCSKNEIERSKTYLRNNPLMKVRFPLIENNICKDDCFYILDSIGLDLPYMYKLGYKNANCTGCVKADNMGYWAAIREDFPQIFNWYAKFERQIGKKDKNGKPRGAAINRRKLKHKECDGAGCNICKKGYIREYHFLDELPKDLKPQRNFSFTCGYSCGAQDMEVEAVKELTKEPTLDGFIVLDKIKSLLKL